MVPNPGLGWTAPRWGMGACPCPSVTSASLTSREGCLKSEGLLGGSEVLNASGRGPYVIGVSGCQNANHRNEGSGCPSRVRQGRGRPESGRGLPVCRVQRHKPRSGALRRLPNDGRTRRAGWHCLPSPCPAACPTCATLLYPIFAVLCGTRLFNLFLFSNVHIGAGVQIGVPPARNAPFH